MRRNITGVIYLLGGFIVLFLLGVHYMHTDPNFKEFADVSIRQMSWQQVLLTPLAALSHACTHVQNIYWGMLYFAGFSLSAFFVGSSIVATLCAPVLCLFWRTGASTLNSDSRMSLGAAWLFLMGYFWFLRHSEED